MPAKSRVCRLILLGQSPLTNSFAQTAALYVEMLAKTESPVLISSQDEAAVALSKHLARALGREAVMDYSWDTDNEEDSAVTKLRLRMKLQLPTSNSEVVCVSPDIIRNALGLLGRPEEGDVPLMAEIEITLGISSAELAAQLIRVVNAEKALLKLCEEPSTLERQCKELSEGFRQELVSTFLTATKIFEPSGANEKPSFAHVSDAISTSYYVFHQRLPEYEAKLDVRQSVSALRAEIRQISETKAIHERIAFNLVGQLTDLKRRITAKSAQIEQLRADLRQEVQVTKRLPVKICKLELLHNNTIVAKVLFLKAIPKSYQIAYFPPCTILNSCTLNCVKEEQVVEIALLSSFRPGDYEVFLHKSGDPSVVKSNRISFLVDMPEGSTPMG